MYIIFGGDDEATVRQILRTFDLNPKKGHIINGHVPVIVKKNESPLKAGGKLIVIDGGGLPGIPEKNRHWRIHPGLHFMEAADSYGLRTRTVLS